MEIRHLDSGELLRRLRYLARRFSYDRCSEYAAALTYMSLFALVPMLTLLFTMASLAPAYQGLEEKLQQLLFTHLIPETSAELQSYLTEFATQARNLTGPGIVFLLVTAVLMLRNIEKAFNTIWRARENRSPVSSFLLYWAILSLAPLTIGVGLGLGTYLTTISTLFENVDSFGIWAMILKALPLLFSAAGFTLLYAAVPNCRVPFKHTLVGGAVVAVVFNSARSLFTMLMVGSNYSAIYGAFAAVPLFLLWIYVSWTIVLAGGILVHSLSSYQSEEQESRPNVLKALDVLYLFWQRQREGLTVREIELLNNSHPILAGLDSITWGELRDLLIQKNVITENDRGQYLLSRDLDNVSFWQLKEWVNAEQPVDREDITTHENWQEEAYNMLKTQRRNQRELMQVSLAELFSR
jgi:membrane protein